MTLADLEKREEEKWKHLKPNDKRKMGLRCLELTNQFRASQGKHALKWNDTMFDIGLVHSEDMACGRVPFGHDGFPKRA